MESKEIAENEKDPGLASFCNLLGSQFVRAKSMQPANLTPENTFVTHTPLGNNPAELIVVDTEDITGDYRRLQIFKLFPTEQPLKLQIEVQSAEEDDEIVVPKFVVLRATPDNDTAVLYGINPKRFVYADTIISGNQDGIKHQDDFTPSNVIELGREILNGDIIPRAEI